MILNFLVLMYFPVLCFIVEKIVCIVCENNPRTDKKCFYYYCSILDKFCLLLIYSNDRYKNRGNQTNKVTFHSLGAPQTDSSCEGATSSRSPDSFLVSHVGGRHTRIGVTTRSFLGYTLVGNCSWSWVGNGNPNQTFQYGMQESQVHFNHSPNITPGKWFDC